MEWYAEFILGQLALLCGCKHKQEFHSDYKG